jgi:hypothetical protein
VDQRSHSRHRNIPYLGVATISGNSAELPRCDTLSAPPEVILIEGVGTGGCGMALAEFSSQREKERTMSTTTIIIILLVVLLLGGGGFFFSRR